MTPLEALEHNPRSLESGEKVQTPDGRRGLLFALGWRYGRVAINCTEPPEFLSDGASYLLKELWRDGEPSPQPQQLTLL